MYLSLPRSLYLVHESDYGVVQNLAQEAQQSPFKITGIALDILLQLERAPATPEAILSALSKLGYQDQVTFQLVLKDLIELELVQGEE